MVFHAPNGDDRVLEFVIVGHAVTPSKQFARCVTFEKDYINRKEERAGSWLAVGRAEWPPGPRGLHA
jgi:hypothetical protein